MANTAVAKLTFYDEACRALAKASTVDEVAQINNEAIGMRAYARQAKNKQLEIESGEIRFKASRRIGQLIALQKASVGLAKPGPKKIGAFPAPISRRSIKPVLINTLQNSPSSLPSFLMRNSMPS